jgi:uncharacterized protein YlxP (DUF503 family)
MIIGVCTIELYLPGNGSLKEKRSTLKPLLLRLRKEFNLATAEVDHHDLWQSAQIVLVTVSNDAGRVQKLLECAVHWIENHRPDLNVVDWQIETL